VAAWSVLAGARTDIAAGRWRLVSGTPPEVRSLRFQPDKRTLGWLALPAELVQYHQVYRAVARSGRIDRSVFRCRQAALPGTSLPDFAEPDPGSALFYLVTAVGPAAEGPHGTSLRVESCELSPPACQ
jgi:hypothetical protein